METDAERKIVELGKKRYWSSVRRNKAKGRVSVTPAGRYIVREATEQLVIGLTEWLREAEGKPGPRHTACLLFCKLPVEASAFIITRACLDALALRKSYTSIALQIGNLLEDEYRFTEIKRQDRTAWNGVLRTFHYSSYAHKRKLLRSLVNKRDIAVETWTPTEKIRLGVVGLELLRKYTGIIEIINLNSSGKTKTEVCASEEFLSWLEKSELRNEGAMPFLLPLNSPPLAWVTLHSGGYRSPELAGKALVRTRHAGQLAALEAADLSRVYRAANALQDTGYRINQKVYTVFKELRDRGVEVAGLPRLEPHLAPPKPADIDTNEEARFVWRKEAHRIKQLNIQLKSKRLSVANIQMVAASCEKAELYWPYQCDFRGRFYARGFFLNPMSGDLARGLLEFAESKPINSIEAHDWLCIQGANCFGGDIKLQTYKSRIAWVKERSQRIKSIAADPLSDLWWAECDDPWQFLSFIFDYAAFAAHGYGYESHLCVSMDGRNNGLQHYSMLFRSPELASATGCRPTEDPPDIYSKVAGLVTQTLHSLVGEEKDGALRLLRLLEGAVPRKMCKPPVMTLPYGSTIKTLQDQLIQWYQEEGRHAQIEGMSPHGFQECGLLASIIWQTIQRADVALPALNGMDYLRSIAKTTAADGVHLSWTTPSGFVAAQGYVEQKSQVIKTALGEGTRRSRLNSPTERLDKKKAVSAFPANYIHSLDAACLVETINTCLDEADEPMSFWFIHDSYGTHAASAPLLAECLRSAHVAVYATDPLRTLRDEVLNSLSSEFTLSPEPKTGSWDMDELKESRYFFT